MAESLVFDIAHSLLGKLSSFAYEEASRVYGVYDDLQGFKDTLSIVKGMLLDNEEKKKQGQALLQWLRQIRDICSDAEDVLDAFECQKLRKQVVKSCGSTSMKVGHFFSSYNPLVFRFRMSHQIKDVKDRLDKVVADGWTKFGFVSIDVDPTPVGKRREMTHSHVDASDVIGRENDKKEIVKFFMQPQLDGDKNLGVVPIVGIGGMGKTTLAKLVFNDKRMDELFALKMWVCVSNDFDLEKIIIKIINSASTSVSAPTMAHAPQENINHLDIEQLQSHLRHMLSSQKFLLVLDDIWNEDRAKWIELQNLLKVGVAGSKILVTTRSISIAQMMGTVSPYVLEGLSLEDCLSVFVKWAFKEGEEKKYPNLVEVGRDIVKKCHGVPLAVRTLGSSLFSKFDLDKWQFVRDHEIWNLKQKSDEILPALKLSYDQMPSYLRPCFAYFSLFPKNFQFNIKIVSNLWLAHGLLQSPDGSQEPENIAREYIDELHSRSFLQDFEKFRYYYVFKVHDLVHDLALYVTTNEFQMVDSRIRNLPEQVRHLSIFEHDPLDQAFFSKSKCVRTILFPIKGVGLDNKTLLDTWVSRYKYLRYLHLSDSTFEVLPNFIGKLAHLRVLDLSRNCKIKRLPHSICKLQNLQFLSIEGCMELETLPKGLGKLISLRQFHITTKQYVLLENEFASLSNLQTLSFDHCENLKSLFRATQLSSLQELFVRDCGSLEFLPLFNLPKLEAFTVVNCETLQLSKNHEIPIQKLRMKYLLFARFPWLQTLPQWIEGAIDTLQTLIIIDCPILKMLPEWLTTMIHLKSLYVYSCPQLLSLPSDIHRLTALEHLSIYNCPEYSQKCQPNFGEYWPIIAHIKEVNIIEPRA